LNRSEIRRRRPSIDVDAARTAATDCLPCRMWHGATRSLGAAPRRAFDRFSRLIARVRQG